MDPGPYEIEVYSVNPKTGERTLIHSTILEIGSTFKMINYDGTYPLSQWATQVSL